MFSAAQRTHYKRSQITSKQPAAPVAPGPSWGRRSRSGGLLPGGCAAEVTQRQIKHFFSSMLLVRYDVSDVDFVRYFPPAGGGFVPVLFHVHICIK